MEKVFDEPVTRATLSCSMKSESLVKAFVLVILKKVLYGFRFEMKVGFK